MVVNSGVKGFTQVVTAIRQVATSVHIVNQEHELELPRNKVTGILKYFGFMFTGDDKVRLFDQSLKFDGRPEKIVNLDQQYRIRVDHYVN